MAEKEHLADASTKINQAAESIFKLATGALALSITFRNTISPVTASARWLLSLSWICLTLVAVSYVFLRIMESQISLFWANQHMEADKAIKQGETQFGSMLNNPQLQQKMKSADICWRVTFISFLGGLLSLLAFALVNNR